MNINKVDNNSFKGKLILRERMFPRRNSQIDASELKELVEAFEKRTANQSGTMFVQKVTKDSWGLTLPRQMNTYFKNGDYTDAIAVADEQLFETMDSPVRKFTVQDAVEKFVSIFRRFKEREKIVIEEIKPIQDKINELQKELEEKRSQIDTKEFNYKILSSAQPYINGQDILDYGLKYDYFNDIDESLKLQNKTISGVK